MNISLTGLNLYESPSLETHWLSIFSSLDYVQLWTFQSYGCKFLLLLTLVLFISVCVGNVWECRCACHCSRVEVRGQLLRVDACLPLPCWSRRSVTVYVFLCAPCWLDHKLLKNFFTCTSHLCLRVLGLQMMPTVVRFRLDWQVLLSAESSFWPWVNTS